LIRAGYLALIGSGETAAAGGQVFEALAQSLPPGFQASVLETPAGFELNSPWVAGRVSDFLQERLQNYHPQLKVIPARKKGTAFSPDSADIIRPLLTSQFIYMGAGSPSYTVRQLSNSLAWDVIRARHSQGAVLALASAAAIAAGRLALPVYEVYKAGEDLHWKLGLDLLGSYGLSLIIIPHWNNNEGGANLDTSRCFMGQERFRQLSTMLSPTDTVLGLDEHTGLITDMLQGRCRVYGKDAVHILKGGNESIFHSGQEFSLFELGNFHIPEKHLLGISDQVWRSLLEAQKQQEFAHDQKHNIPEEVARLAAQRQAARKACNWAEADLLRDLLRRSGWQVNDTPQGQVLQPMDKE